MENAMWDLEQNLRNTTKYGKSILDDQKNTTPEEYETTEKYL